MILPTTLKSYLTKKSSWKEYLYVATKLYEEKFGVFPYPEIGPYGEIKGTDWEENDEVFRSRWPRLYEKYW